MDMPRDDRERSGVTRIPGISVNFAVDDPVAPSHFAAIAIERDRAVQALRRNQAWLEGQKEAFQVAMDGAPLEASLGILIRTAIEQADDDRRCAFYIANADGTELQHVTGMTGTYAQCVQGFKIGPDSLACGLAVHTGRPVVTRDVLDEPRWKPWTWMASEYGYRACWSFPVETSAGKVVGSFAMYFKEPREATPQDRELAAALTHTASIIISRHQESEERARVSQALLVSERSLAAELGAARTLQSISAELIHEQGLGKLYDKVVEAATVLMRAQFASMQMLHPERGELRLIAFRGFTPEAARAWAWVHAGSETSCGMALRVADRVIVPDIETCGDRLGIDDKKMFRQTGIVAMQTTPLISRSGRLLGMISTHWDKPHEPSEADLRLFDVLARQAADLIERAQADEALQRRADQLKLLVDELNHRVKNTLATVQSLVMQTLHTSRDADDAEAKLDARLVALSEAHDILTRERWEGAPLRGVVDAATRPYRTSDDDRFAIDGPQVWVSPKQALALAMALHELCTNAVKYGSLSNDAGRVRITWEVTASGDACQLALVWTETGGPPVSAPAHRGFGSRLIERGLQQDLGGGVRIDFPPAGIRCEITAPIACDVA